MLSVSASPPLKEPLSQVAITSAAALALGVSWFFVPDPLTPIAVILAAGALYFAIAQPYVTCIIFLVFTYFRLHEAFPVLYSLRLPLICSVLAIISIGWHMTISKEIRPFWRRELTYFSVFFMLTTMGVAFAINRPAAFSMWSVAFWKMGVMTFALAWLARKPRDFKLASAAFIASGAALAAVALYNKSAGIGLVEGTRVTIGRDINSDLGDPNDLALVLLFPLSFAISWFLQGGKKALCLLAAGLILGGIAVTQSRGGLLGVVAVAFVFGRRSLRSKSIVVICCLGAALLLYHIMQITSREFLGASEFGMDESAADRLDTWRVAIAMALDRPLTGVGLNNFADNYYFYTTQFHGRSFVAHSTWFSALGETGFPGLIAFIGMLASCFSSVLNSLRRTQNAPELAELHGTAMALFGALVGFCASGTFLNQAFNWPIYVIVALGAALSRTIEEHTCGA